MKIDNVITSFFCIIVYCFRSGFIDKKFDIVTITLIYIIYLSIATFINHYTCDVCCLAKCNDMNFPFGSKF